MNEIMTLHMHHMKSLATLLILSAAMAFGQTTLVTSSAALTPNDSVDWSQFGVSLTAIPSPAVATTANSSTVVASLAGTESSFMRLDQGNGWNGNFAANSKLLWSNYNGAITIDPSLLVFGAGARIQSDYYGAFVAQIQAYDANNTLLGTVSEAGTASYGGAETIYLGFTSTVAVDHFSFSLVSATGGLNSFAIGQLDLVTEGDNPPPVTPVPEPSTYGLMAGAALAGLGFLRRRRKA